MRNIEKDEREMAERREMMLEAGFRIFAEKGIETVSMQEVADECGLGIATVYRYFSNKLLFVIAIGARKWREYFGEVERKYAARGIAGADAAEELAFYLDSYIALYRQHPDMLKFNQNFNGYILHEHPEPEQMSEYLVAAALFVKKFHRLYEKGLLDGSIRTDDGETVMFNSTMHIMLAVCCRFAQGVVVHTDDPEDLTMELQILKNMILDRYVIKH
ncbi:MAG: TetR/AcrR family transcriptional regulator [Clostridia bacterium]|nr:TetR/AcrR family transcriptional regulator [Clostridia bacterium]